METGALDSNGLRSWLFLNFLRGMETYRCAFAYFGTRTFLNFLRGMETERGRSAHSRILAS